MSRSGVGCLETPTLDRTPGESLRSSCLGTPTLDRAPGGSLRSSCLGTPTLDRAPGESLRSTLPWNTDPGQSFGWVAPEYAALEHRPWTELRVGRSGVRCLGTPTLDRAPGESLRSTLPWNTDPGQSSGWTAAFSNSFKISSEKSPSTSPSVVRLPELPSLLQDFFHV